LEVNYFLEEVNYFFEPIFGLDYFFFEGILDHNTNGLKMSIQGTQINEAIRRRYCSYY